MPTPKKPAKKVPKERQKKRVTLRRESTRRAVNRKPLKLTVDLVPQTSWYRNLRKEVPPRVWDELRKEVYAKAGFKCQICKAKGKLNCHEIWEFDERNHVQRLKGFHAVCSMCHHVTHLGMSSILARQGNLDMEKVIKHFMYVNNVSRKALEAHLVEAMTIWKRRSQYEWAIDYGQWGELIQNPQA